MGKPTIKQLIKDIIAGISWKIFLWAIEMTPEKYWKEVYKSERDRMSIDTFPEREVRREYF